MAGTKMNNGTAQIVLNDGRLQVSGDINFRTAVSLSKASLPLLAQCKSIIFDLSRVNNANSAALALLLEWIKYAKKNKKSISFEKLPAQLTSIAMAAGINQFLQ
jgi:phospholipid transport system transporter-binding protein